MRQPGELAQHLQHRLQVEPEEFARSKRRQRIRLVMQPEKCKFADGEQYTVPARKKRRVVLTPNSIVAVLGRIETEADHSVDVSRPLRSLAVFTIDDRRITSYNVCYTKLLRSKVPVITPLPSAV